MCDTLQNIKAVRIKPVSNVKYEVHTKSYRKNEEFSVIKQSNIWYVSWREMRAARNAVLSNLK